MNRAIIDCFSVGIDELPRKQQRDDVAVARVLAQHGRFSIFEATANRTIANTMTRIAESGWFVFDRSPPYPWTRVTLTEVGRAVVETGVVPEKKPPPATPAATRKALCRLVPKACTVHRAHLISERGVSALCFARPRPIDMTKRVSWTTTDEAVTCPKCLKVMGGALEGT